MRGPLCPYRGRTCGPDLTWQVAGEQKCTLVGRGYGLERQASHDFYRKKTDPRRVAWQAIAQSLVVSPDLYAWRAFNGTVDAAKDVCAADSTCPASRAAHCAHTATPCTSPSAHCLCTPCTMCGTGRVGRADRREPRAARVREDR